MKQALHPTTPCPTVFLNSVRNTCAWIFSTTATLTAKSDPDAPMEQSKQDFVAHYEAIVQKAEKRAEGIRGNRGDGVVITCGDVRMIFENALRVAIELLAAD